MEKFHTVTRETILFKKDEVYGTVVAIVRRRNADVEVETHSESRHSVKSNSAEYADSSESCDKDKKEIVPWWRFNRPVYSFSDTKIQIRLEKLMGTSEVRLLDKNYFLALQKNIKLLHLQHQKSRLEKRTAEEAKRSREIMLRNKLAINERHSILRNPYEYARRQKAKMTVLNLRSKCNISGKTSVSSIHSRKSKESEISSLRRLDSAMFDMPKERYNAVNFQDPRIESLKHCKGLEELYRKADDIIKNNNVKEF